MMMSDTKTRMPLAQARAVAEAIKAELAPGCQRVEIAGSIRRERPEVGDLEIVAIPLPAFNLFHEQCGTLLNPILYRLEVDEGRLEKIKGGAKYQQYRVAKAGCTLDLFLCDAATWGCIYLIRTGPAEWSKRLVTSKQEGGLCPNDMRFQNGRLLRHGKLLETSDEESVFLELGLEWLEPRERR